MPSFWRKSDQLQQVSLRAAKILLTKLHLPRQPQCQGGVRMRRQKLPQVLFRFREGVSLDVQFSQFEKNLVSRGVKS